MKTKMNNNSRSSFISKEEKALNLFADMMIEKLKTLKKTGKSHGSQNVASHGLEILAIANITE